MFTSSIDTFNSTQVNSFERYMMLSREQNRSLALRQVGGKLFDTTNCNWGKHTTDPQTATKLKLKAYRWMYLNL